MRSMNSAGARCDPEYSSCPAAALLGELSGVAKFFLVTGYTDMRKSIDGLMAIVRDTYEFRSITVILCSFSAADAVTGSKRFISKKMDSAFIINV